MFKTSNNVGVIAVWNE